MRENLTPKQHRAIEALLTSGDMTRAAERAGVSRETLYKWLKSEPFRQELKAGEAKALEALSRRLVALGDSAVLALQDGLNADNPTAVRLRAADIIIGRLLQLKELVNLDERVSALEEKQNEQHRKPY